MRKIFLDNLPRWEKGGHKGRVKWKETPGHSVKFIYDDLEGEINILDYHNKTNKLTLKYSETTMDLYINHFSNCAIGKLIGNISSFHYYEVGQIIDHISNGRLQIKEQTRIGNNRYKHKGYKYKCLKCSNEDEITENDLNRKRGCNVCAGKKVLKGFNDLWTVAPWLAELLYDPEDGYKYTIYSSKTSDFKCLTCYRKIENKPISRIYYNKGLSCPSCSDNFSYPEKFVCNMLDQLDIPFLHELSSITFKWCNGFRYDFYLKSSNSIIETHGAQHYFHTGRGRGLIEEQENDRAKEELAMSNGIEHYIALDCRNSDLEWIKSQILNSKLCEMFDLKNINWHKCHESSIGTLVKKVCELYNEGKRQKEISSLLKIGRNTVRRYLKIGSSLEWCNYETSEEIQKNLRYHSKKVIQLSLENEYIRTFNSTREVGRELNILNISKACMGKQKTAGGFKWMYKEDYEKYIEQQIKEEKINEIQF